MYTIINKNKYGFTLIELLVVISILATLFAIVLPNFQGARERARDAQKIQDLNAMKNALRLYYNDHQSYPVYVDPMSDISTELSAYMPSLSESGIGYTYYAENEGDAFRLCTRLEAGVGDDDINSQLRCGIGVSHCSVDANETSDKLYEVCAN